MTIKMAVAMTTMMMMRMRMNMMTMTVMIMDGYDCGEDFFLHQKSKQTTSFAMHALLGRLYTANTSTSVTATFALSAKKVRKPPVLEEL